MQTLRQNNSLQALKSTLRSAEPHMNKDCYRKLENRIGRLHLKQRLGIESDYDAKVFGQGLNFFHIENWYSVHSMIRNALRLAGLHGRGKKNARAIQVSHNDLVIPGLPKAFDGYVILHISDLHLDMHPDIPDVLIEAVVSTQYDLCVLTGDFRAKTFGPYTEALTALERVRPYLDAPVYAVLGNHDTIRMVPGIEDLDIRMLLNESTSLARDGSVIYLAGIDDPHYFQADNLEKAAAGFSHDDISILLSHSPEIYRHAAHAEFDVMLCGHTHGGQICWPGGSPIMRNARCPRKLCSGAWKYHNLMGYTSRGSGVSVVDVRLNCPPEITLHRLRATDKRALGPVINTPTAA
jgi:predicted MPP superfamily phosphohydrolase